MISKSVPVRKLGKNGPIVPALGYGLMGMSYSYGTPPSDEERFKVLDRAVELGATFWDSADMYGDSHTLLNKWFKRTGKRNEIFLATKSAYVIKDGTFTLNSSGDYLKDACYKDLADLGLEYVDLFYCHGSNPATPIEDTMRGLKALKEQGKTKYIGLCEITSNTLRRAVKIAPVDVVQVEYSPFVRHIEGPEGTDLLATCRELGISIVCFSPLGRGLLTGTVTKETLTQEGDYRSVSQPRFQGENFDANVRLVAQFKAIAERKGCTSSQLALAWLLKQGNDIIPIPGTKKIKYLEENWGALDVKLSDDDEKEIRTFLEEAKVAGGRVPEQYEHLLLVDTREES